MGWKYKDESLKQLYKEYKNNIKAFSDKQAMSYKEFKKMAEQFANQLIDNVKKEAKDAKEAIEE